MELLVGDRSAAGRLTLAAPSFVNEALLPRLATDPDRSLRAVAVPPILLEEYAARKIFDAAVVLGDAHRFSPVWSRTEVGLLRYGLFASPETAARIGPQPTLDHLASLPFVAAVYVSREGELVVGDDRCPIPRAYRKIVHEVETVGLACKIAAESSFLVYGPVVAASALVAQGALVEVHVRGWRRSDPLFLVTNRDFVSASETEALAAALHEIFREQRWSGVVSIGGDLGFASRRQG